MRGKLRNQNALNVKSVTQLPSNFSRLWPPSRTLRSIAFHTKKLTYKASVTITINCNVLDANQIVIQLYTIKVTFQVLFHSFHLLRKENKSMHLLQNQKQLWQLSFSASREKKFKWPHLKLWKRLDQSVLVLIVGHSRSTVSWQQDAWNSWRGCGCLCQFSASKTNSLRWKPQIQERNPLVKILSQMSVYCNASIKVATVYNYRCRYIQKYQYLI